MASLLAVLAFARGAGRAVHRGDLLAAATSVQAGVVLVASVIASTAGVQRSPVRLTLIGLLVVAMGGKTRSYAGWPYPT